MKPGINMHKAKRRRTRGKYLETLTQVPGVQTLAVENKQARGYMTRVRTLSLVSPEEKAAGDGGDARGDHEFDIDQIGSRFTPASLAAALKPHCVSDKFSVFSRVGLWRGPLSALPQSFPLQLPSSLPVLELVLLPEEDDGSLALSLARAQLSVPLLPERAPQQPAAYATTTAKTNNSAVPSGTTTPATTPSVAVAASPAVAPTTDPELSLSGKGTIEPAEVIAVAAGSSGSATTEGSGSDDSSSGGSGNGDGSQETAVVSGGEDGAKAHADLGGSSTAASATNSSSVTGVSPLSSSNGPDAPDPAAKGLPNLNSSASTVTATITTDNNNNTDGGMYSHSAGAGAGAATAATADDDSKAAQRTEKPAQAKAVATASQGAASPSSWGLSTDVVNILANNDASLWLSEEQRRQLAKDALRAGDVDRLLICLGRLEGEAPRVVGGRADWFDDPVAVADRARRREEEGEGRRSNRGDSTEAPMWAPPFPPEEYDDYENEDGGMENQDFSAGGAPAGGGHAGPPGGPSQPLHHIGGSRICRGGQQPSADLVEALRRLLQALGDAERVVVLGEKQGGSGEQDTDSAGISPGGTPTAEGIEPVSLSGGGRAERWCSKTGFEDGNRQDGGGDVDDCSLVAAVLEGSCLRSVCRQYMFGVDWRFVSVHRLFYRSLLRLLRDTLDPAICALQSGDLLLLPPPAPMNERGLVREGSLVRGLLAASADCPSLVDLLVSLCVALDDLVACPPQAPAPLPAPPTPLPPPPTPLPPSPGLNHPPPSPASPNPALMQMSHVSATAAATTAAASGSVPLPASFAAFASPAGLAQFASPKIPAATASSDAPGAGAATPGGPQVGLPSPFLAVAATTPAAAPASTTMISVSPAAPPSSSTPTVSTVIGGTPSTPGQSVGVVPPLLASAHGSCAHSSPGAATSIIVTSGESDGVDAVAGAGIGGGDGDGAAAVVPQQQSQSSTSVLPLALAPSSSPPPPPPPLPSLPVPVLTPPLGMFKPAAAPSPAISGPGGVTGLSAVAAVAAETSKALAASRAKEEQSRAAQYEKEKWEHEEGMELAALARTVLEQAKAVEKAETAAVKIAPAVTTGDRAKSSVIVSATGHADSGNTGVMAGREGVEECKGERAAMVTASPRLAEEDTVPSEEELYLKVMEGEQFGTMRMETSNSGGSNNCKREQQHHFWRAATTEGPAPPRRQRRLVRELRSLARELPLYWGSTVAVRVDEDRPHLLKAMVAAPGGTPYDSGLFQFDIYCPPQYPDVPPRVNLMTTGRGTVRFNPNLYPCGNVCLSLLGTWSGSPEMMWSPDASLLQVLLSIQTFILGAQFPYFNEPGLELDFGNPGSMDRARTSPNGGYEVLRPATVEWAMMEALSNPPRGFEMLAREHLWRKKWYILEVVSGWLREGRSPGGLPRHYRDLLASLQGFIKELIQLSKTAGNCPVTRPPPKRDNQESLQTAGGADACCRCDPQRLEYEAAMRGLLGPEAGPPRPPPSRARNGASSKAKVSNDTTMTTSAAAAAATGATEVANGDASGVASNATIAPSSATSTATAIAATTAPTVADSIDNGTNEKRLLCSGCTCHHRPRWETPQEARERLRFRLEIISRRLGVAIASAAAGPPRRAPAERWGVAAGKLARAAGVGSLHGKALTASEAIAAGKQGVTWSSHPHFRKYFTLLRLGIPHEEVVAAANRNGVDPKILEYADEEIPLSAQFGVVSTCAPLLRVSPGLASTPIAQLMASSGIIYTADPSKAFGRAGSATATASTSTSTSFCSAGDGNDDDDVAPAAVGSACTEESCDAGASSTGCATYTLPPNVGNTTLQTVEGGGGADSQKGATTEAVAEAMVDTNEPCDPAEAHQHSLVLSGRRVWVVSPVVGWASVWAETGQKILRPAAEIEEEERAAKEKGGMGIGGLPGPAGPSEVPPPLKSWAPPKATGLSVFMTAKNGGKPQAYKNLPLPMAASLSQEAEEGLKLCSGVVPGDASSEAQQLGHNGSLSVEGAKGYSLVFPSNKQAQLSPVPVVPAPAYAVPQKTATTAVSSDGIGAHSTPPAPWTPASTASTTVGAGAVTLSNETASRQNAPDDSATAAAIALPCAGVKDGSNGQSSIGQKNPINADAALSGGGEVVAGIIESTATGVIAAAGAGNGEATATAAAATTIATMMMTPSVVTPPPHSLVASLSVSCSSAVSPPLPSGSASGVNGVGVGVLGMSADGVSGMVVGGAGQQQQLGGGGGEGGGAGVGVGVPASGISAGGGGDEKNSKTE